MKKTKIAFLITALISLCHIAILAQQIPTSVKRIVFLGNSITWQGTYINDIEAYLKVHHPECQFEIINVGLPSETVSGLSEVGHAGGAFPRPDLHERLDRVLAETKPDLVFACYGMNDGIYKSFDEERFDKFKQGINWLHQKVVETGASIIHLTPPDYDEQNGKSIGYTNVLNRYSDWLLSLRSSLKWIVFDIHYPMQKYLKAHRKIDSKFKINGFALAEDGIHPNEVGHWIMAKAILKALGYNAVENSLSIQDDLSKVPNGNQILKLVKKKQHILRDAWLTLTKFKRPGMAEGLPMPEARSMAKSIDLEIAALIQNKK